MSLADIRALAPDEATAVNGLPLSEVVALVRELRPLTVAELRALPLAERIEACRRLSPAERVDVGRHLAATLARMDEEGRLAWEGVVRDGFLTRKTPNGGALRTAVLTTLATKPAPADPVGAFASIVGQLRREWTERECGALRADMVRAADAGDAAEFTRLTAEHGLARGVLRNAARRGGNG